MCSTYFEMTEKASVKGAPSKEAKTDKAFELKNFQLSGSFSEIQ